MIPLNYLALRIVRRHLPDEVVRSLLRRRIIIKPGLETTAPAAAVQRFLEAIGEAGESVGGKRILIFGYGGNFGVGGCFRRVPGPWYWWIPTPGPTGG